MLAGRVLRRDWNYLHRC